MDEFRRYFEAAGGIEKDMKAPPGLELADVAWPIVSAQMAEVTSELGQAAAAAGIPEGAQQAILNRLAYNLYILVFGATSRAMVVEMAAAEATGLMQGETPEERYAFFAEMLDDAAFGEQVLGQYPVLQKQLVSLCCNWTSATVELLSRLAADRELIDTSFFSGAPAGEVVDLEISAGDVHRRGHTTCIVKFSGGARLVYKPRPLAVELHFREFADWINQHLGKRQILVPRTVDQGDYGWSEFITHDPVAHEGEAAAYYERLGAVLALAFLTGLSDLHAENIIAHGAWPVLVDLETLFRPVIKDDTFPGAKRESTRLLDQSVLATQLLAARASNEDDERMVDMGGIVDLTGQETAFKVPVWRDIGRVDARLDHSVFPLEPAQNIPILNDRRVPGDGYLREIVGGFSEVYRLLRSRKGELKQPEGPLAGFRDDLTRLVLRPTSLYARLVAAGFHPDFLEDPGRKTEFFESYLADDTSKVPGHEDLVAAEIEDLWQCDIPYFQARAGDRDIISSSGRTLVLQSRTSGLDKAFERLDRLDDEDLTRQCWLIGVMLARSGSSAGRESLPLIRPAEGPGIREAARAVAHTAAGEICARAIFDAGRERATWLSVGEAANVATVSDADLDLYSGLPGIALFLNFAGRLLGEPRYCALAGQALAETVSRIDGQDPADMGAGGFVGSGGLAYALCLMSPDFPDLSLRDRAAGIFLATDHEAPAELEVAHGLAGALLAGLTIAAQIRSGPDPDRETADLVMERASTIGRLIAERIAEAGPGDDAPDSFAHGRAGIGAALARLAGQTGDPEIGALAHRLLNRTSEIVHSGEFNASWCRGRAGLALALAEGPGFLDDGQSFSDALDRLAAGDMPDEHSLCHGAMGLVMTLQACRPNAQPADPGEGSVTDRYLRSMMETGLLCGTINSVVSPGLMDGLAGIGLGALSILEPESVPSVLSLAGSPGPGRGAWF